MHSLARFVSASVEFINLFAQIDSFTGEVAEALKPSRKPGFGQGGQQQAQGVINVEVNPVIHLPQQVAPAAGGAAAVGPVAQAADVSERALAQLEVMKPLIKAAISDGVVRGSQDEGIKKKDRSRRFKHNYKLVEQACAEVGATARLCLRPTFKDKPLEYFDAALASLPEALADKVKKDSGGASRVLTQGSDSDSSSSD